ncbi:792_t:CDS:2 [Ambispora gerdemannii]|uniref:792_t:CDS:1 n=1 Tax=Ambispora gerdemannii TaxID=144530 RepID=A0A9N8YUP4_9GLOM|nr:792_t:CDS:2 [Ambispora gerdemannii]
MSTPLHEKTEEKENLKLDTKEAAARFWQKFQVEREAITNDIASLSNTTTTSIIAKQCDNILERINNLEKKLTEATIYLPSYDQRQLSSQIKSMIDELNKQRARLAPKQKFSFKSRKAFLTVNSYLSSSVSSRRIDFQLTDLTNCVVNLVSKKISIGAIHIRGLKNSVMLVGPVGSSVLIHDCERCVFVVGCHQFRMHTSKKMTIYLHVTSHPIIEDCHDIQFAPYTLSIDGLDKMFEAVKLESNINHYDKVEDFNWLRQQASPNWKLLPEEKILKDWPNTLLVSVDGDEKSSDNNGNNDDNLSEGMVNHLLKEILE